MSSEISSKAGSPLGLSTAKGAATADEVGAHLSVKLFAAEFLAITVAAYVAGLLYHSAVEPWLGGVPYAVPALFIAALVAGVSAGLRHYVEFQRQPLHVLLWGGIGATAIAFSLFVSALFLMKISDDYSRGAFIFQVLAVCFAVCLARTTSHFRVQSAVRSGRLKLVASS